VDFDVKTTAVCQGKILFDVAQVEKLRTFARLFHLTVYFACLDPEGSQDGFWVRLDQLDGLSVTRRRFGHMTFNPPWSASGPDP
jgi:hypothetical protein